GHEVLGRAAQRVDPVGREDAPDDHRAVAPERGGLVRGQVTDELGGGQRAADGAHAPTFTCCGHAGHLTPWRSRRGGRASYRLRRVAYRIFPGPARPRSPIEECMMARGADVRARMVAAGE